MAHSLSAKKRVRQGAKRRLRNRVRKDDIRTSQKSFASALAKGDITLAVTELNKVVSVLDRVASKHTIHKNAAARKRSRLTKRLNAARGKTGATAKA